MPLRGGSSDKLGNRYEGWWTVSCLLGILASEAESIRIEEPGEDSIEFVLVKRGKKEYHQAKRNTPLGSWTIAALGSTKVGVLKAIKEKLSGSDSKFLFVSGSESRELKELTDRSRDAESYEEFTTKFLQAKAHSENFQKLQRFWDDVAPEVAYELLQRLTLRTIDERGLVESTRNHSRALFLERPETVLAELRSIVLDSVHQTLTRDDLITSLRDSGIQLRRIQNPQDVPNVVRQATDAYLESIRRKLIGGTLIPREAVESLCQKVLASTESMEIAIVGKAGGGKTASLLHLAQGLVDGGVSVLAFRLYPLEPVYNSKQLGEKIGLEESPALIVSSLSATGPSAILIDQLDALSIVSGRGTEAFYETLEQVLSEVRGLRTPHPIHVIVACRSFDWSNDARFRSMLRNNHLNFEVSDFSMDEVEHVLSDHSFDVSGFQERQTRLLCLPRNLYLFLESHIGSEREFKFLTEKDLFDQYWDEKRKHVGLRVHPHSDGWTEVIQSIVEIMSDSEQLFSPKEMLDALDQVYLGAMCSESVLTFDGKRYGFGHESFYDYCFARKFVANGQSLCEVLKEGSQGLFVRSMVRQVLVYMRDYDFPTYIQQVDSLLSDDHIRIHIKDLVLALLASVPEPTLVEWKLFAARVDRFFELASARSQYGTLEALVWHHFFLSTKLFDVAYSQGELRRWLGSVDDHAINILIHYFYYEQRHHAEEIAELLEPYVGVNPVWDDRVRRVMEGASSGDSRRSFDLFLKLLELGVLDSARDRWISNGTFWSMCSSWSDSRPDWLAELIARWLARRLQLFLDSGRSTCQPAWRGFLENESDVKHILMEVAQKAPAEYVKYVLPVVLQIIEEAVVKGSDELPRVDYVEMIYHVSESSMTRGILRESLFSALDSLRGERGTIFLNAVQDLRGRNTYFSNHLLLRLYTSSASQLAEVAAELLCNEPWRLSCGYADSEYWVAARLLGEILPHLAADDRERLERVVLDFVPKWERQRKHNGYLQHGQACFELLSGIPEKLLSPAGRKRLQELVRKFGSPSGPPKRMEASFVTSPVPHEASGKMTNDQWIRAIKKYNDESSGRWFQTPGKGGPAQLAGELELCVKSEPERFAKLALVFPSGTNPVFFSRILRGLKECEGFDKAKTELCRRVISEYKVDCGTELVEILPSFQGPIPEDLLDFLRWTIANHPDPATELWDQDSNGGGKYYGGDIYDCGLNTTRGAAAGVLRELVRKEPKFIDTLRDTLTRLIGDPSIAVRSCAATTLQVVYWHNEDLAVELFQELVNTDERLLGTHYVQEFLHWSLRHHIEDVRNIVLRMLVSGHSEVRRGGGRLAGLAELYHESEASLAASAMAGDTASRLGIAEIAAKNLGIQDCRFLCEDKLLVLFNDENEDIQKCSATCFQSLEEKPVGDFEKLIEGFCRSRAFETDSSELIELLVQSTYRVPGVLASTCERYLTWFEKRSETGARDLAYGVSMKLVSQLIFRIYQQHKGDVWGTKALDLIDRMCLVGVSEVRGGLSEFDR